MRLFWGGGLRGLPLFYAIASSAPVVVVRGAPVVHPYAQHRAQLTSSGNSGTNVVRFHPAGHALLQVVNQNRGHLRVLYVRCLKVLVDQIHCLACYPPGRTPADPLGFGQPGHNVADGVPLQDPF